MKSKNLCLVVALVCCGLFSGCEETMKDRDVLGRYNVTTLKVTTAADVLGSVGSKDEELVCHTASVVASWGQDEDAEMLWFNVVAFDEDHLTAMRKYALLIKETGGASLMGLKPQFRFDGQSAGNIQLLTEPYENENVRMIAILKDIHSSFKGDTKQVVLEDGDLTSGVWLAKHVFATILTKLDMSPALASRLSSEYGMAFDHMTLGPGRIRMLIRDDVVTVKIKVGENSAGFESHTDVKKM